jgi:hypothetical protein
MAHSLISTRLLKSFPTGMLKMRRGQANRHFQMYKAIFLNIKAGSTVGHRERRVGRVPAFLRIKKCDGDVGD